MDFLPAIRCSNIARMQQHTLDIIVIGGGITGAGIARDAALRGYTVALLERDDFASGTSSKSARMVHGGLRYLEEYQFGLVLSACAERFKLYKMAPRLVRPTPFTYPVYKGARHGLLKVRMGMWLYDLLAMFRNFRLHRILDARQAVTAEPLLSRDGLAGAACYYDCLEDDSRLTLATIL
ncbi:MAG: FAD-dependent oxidoreductase, partial [Chloroflexi bacterium]|nr:FAD-dependent oxidoreductase [Chloroflexota bacterium]